MNSEKWQERVRSFVEREIKLCVSHLVSELAGGELQSNKAFEELLPILNSENFIDAANEKSTIEERKGWFENARSENEEGEAPNYFFTDNDDAREFCSDQDISSYEREALEHWVVSDWLARKLEAKGEMVLQDFCGLTIWGRTTTGQGIYIDDVINEIYAELMANDIKSGKLAKELGLED